MLYEVVPKFAYAYKGLKGDHSNAVCYAVQGGSCF